MSVPNPDSPISIHFTWKEALFLPQWNRLAEAADGLTDEIEASLKDLFTRVDAIRDFFQKPIRVHCAYRPHAYNALVGGAVGSSHVSGQAVDFDVEGKDCDFVRAALMHFQLLGKFGLRMENRPQSNWVHLDTRPVPNGSLRFFTP